MLRNSLCLIRVTILVSLGLPPVVGIGHGDIPSQGVCTLKRDVKPQPNNILLVTKGALWWGVQGRHLLLGPL